MVVWGLVEGLLDSMKADGLGGLGLIEGVMEIVGEVLGLADVHELKGQMVVEDVLALMGVVVGLLEVSEEELAAGLLPGAEGSGGPAGGPRTDDPCSAGTGSLLCTACDGPEDTTWLLISLDKVPASSHTSFRRCKNN